MNESRENALAKLKELLEGIDFCMLTTVDGNHLRSRPMSTQEIDENGHLWFFTRDNTHKMAEIDKEPRVNVAYAEPDDNTYVSVSGIGELSYDRAQMEKLWDPIHKAWFPDGLEDPNICLLKVVVEQAEYWDASSSTLVQIVGFIKAIATGTEATYGENKKLQF